MRCECDMGGRTDGLLARARLQAECAEACAANDSYLRVVADA